MITHNQNVLQEFDKIIFLEKGEMKFFGSSTEFIKISNKNDNKKKIYFIPDYNKISGLGHFIDA